MEAYEGSDKWISSQTGSDEHEGHEAIGDVTQCSKSFSDFVIFFPPGKKGKKAKKAKLSFCKVDYF